MAIANEVKKQQNKDEMLRRALERIIQLYTDKSHFIYELLQNAEDANATNIKFVQKIDQLEVYHNGTPFTQKNLISLCDIGISDKAENLNQIGEFGVGFKSVFGICDKVKLYSYPKNYRENLIKDMKDFAVEIIDFTSPIDIEHNELEKPYTTKFIFPYSVGYSFSGFKDVSLLRNAIMKRLRNLGVSTLLFMKNLKSIEYEIDIHNNSHSGFYMLECKTLSEKCQLLTTVGASDKKDESLSYLKFIQKVNLDDNDDRSVDIAFPITIDRLGKYVYHKATSPFISVYFPTETESKLDFVIQGPYRTTPNRSSVPSDDEDNIQFAKLTAQLLYESVVDLKNQGQLNLSLLNILPLDEDAFDSYDLFHPVFEKSVELFQNEGILLCKYGGYVKSSSAKLVRGRELAELLDDALLSELVDDDDDDDNNNNSEADTIKQYRWLVTELTEGNKPYKDLYEFLTSYLEVEVVRPEDFRDFISYNCVFLTKRNTDWLIKFYNYLEKVPNLFNRDRFGSSMLLVKFVKTTSNNFVAPFRRNDSVYLPNVFLPVDSPLEGVNFIHEELYVPCKKFFSDVLNLTSPNTYACFKQSFEIRYGNSNATFSDDQHIEDVKRLLENLAIREYKDDSRQLLPKLSLRCLEKGISSFIKVNNKEIYFAITEEGVSAKSYFQGIKDICIIDDEFYKTKGITRKDLQQLGVCSEIVVGNESMGWYYGSGNSQNRDQGDFRSQLSFKDIQCLLRYIAQHPSDSLSKTKSKITLQLLFKYENHLSGIVVKGKSIGAQVNSVASIINTLRGHYYSKPKWLYSNSGLLVSPDEISKYELDPNVYGRINKDSEVYTLLNFAHTKKDKLEDTFNTILEQDDIVQDELLNDLCISRLNISLNDLKERLLFAPSNQIETETFNSEEPEFYTFPERKILDYDKLRNHIAGLWKQRIPVKKEKLLRIVRTSEDSKANRMYVFDMYGNDYDKEKFTCQICRKATSKLYIEVNQIEANPLFEWPQMHLSLCVECSRDFEALRNNKQLADAFISDLSIVSLDQDEPIEIPIDDINVSFTLTHLAEIQEILRLQNSIDMLSEQMINDFDKMKEPINSIDNATITNISESVKLDKIIFHKKFGRGVVTYLDVNYATIAFDNGYNSILDMDMCLKNKIVIIAD